MRTKVSKLARGIFDKVTPELLFSVSIIDGKIQANSSLYGSFAISSQNDLDLRGLIYSNNPQVLCIEKTFIGKEITIHYEVHAVGNETGDKIRGEFLIICNGGEFTVPYEFIVDSPYIESSMGQIRNLFHFANLVQQDYEEALKIFCSKDFVSTFLLENQEQASVYEGLIKGSSAQVALEEFLIYVHKKSRIELSIENTEIEYPDFQASVGDKLYIHKNTWGYLEIQTEVDCDFIEVKKKIFSTDDFAGKIYELLYFIDEKKLHAGFNYGKLYLKTLTQNLEVTFTVYKSVGNQAERERKRIAKEGIYDLVQLYFDFRLHKITTDLWCKSSLNIVMKLEEFEEYEDFITLLKIQIWVTQKKKEYVLEALSEMKQKIQGNSMKQVFLHSYYLYVKSLYVRDNEFTKDALKQVKEYYKKNNRDFRLLWVIFYLEKEHFKDNSLILDEIRKQYYLGCNSPFLYFEACEIIKKQVDCITQLNDFELQILWWGCKLDLFNEEVAEVILELSIYVKNFHPLHLRVLIYLYRRFNKIIVLESICRMLIRNGMLAKKYFYWYELGIKNDLNLTGLYEHYINTMSEDYSGEIPKIVLLYFAYYNNLSDRKKAFIYHYVIEKAKENPTMLRNYMPSIEIFAKEQIVKGNISENLALIYKTVISKTMLTGQIAEAYPNLLLTQYFVCENPFIKNIIVRHKELDEESKYAVVNREAYFPVYTEGSTILLEDNNSKRYLLPENHSMKSLMNEESYLRVCSENTGGDIYLWLHICEKGNIYREGQDTRLEMYRKIVQYPELKQYYKNIISWSIIDYYLDNYDGDHLEESLKAIENHQLNLIERSRLVELYIVRSMYREAYSIMKISGYYEVSPRLLTKFCTRMIQMEERKEDSFLLGLCAYIFKKGKYDEIILEYLIIYYHSTTADMLLLWKTAKDFSVDTLALAERLIVQTLFTQVNPSNIFDVFEEYYIRGSKEIVIYAYLACQSFYYFAKDDRIPEKTFLYIEKEGLNNRELIPICKLALLKYYSIKDSLTEEQVALGEIYLKELLLSGKMFKFYKGLESKIRIPHFLKDKSILEYRTESGTQVTLHYLLPEQKSETRKYEVFNLEESYEGIYTKDFILFYKENLQYYITEEYTVNLSENGILEMEDWEEGSKKSRFGHLNAIILAHEENGGGEVEELVKSYDDLTYMVEEWFTIL